MALKKKHIFLILKLIFIVVALAFVFKKSDTSQIFEYIKSVNPFLLIASCFFLLIAQVASAFRMQHYFKSGKLELNNKFCIGLYFTGMLFNTILPGGIGGDGYKVYSVSKLAGFSKMSAIRLLVSDRANGLFVLVILSLIFAIVSGASSIIPYAKSMTYVSLLMVVPAYFLSIKIILKEGGGTAINALPFSIIVQLSGVVSIVFILQGLGLDVTNLSQVSGYIFVFLVSSILSVLPISIGGVGIRELAFMYGSKVLGLDANLGVAIAIIFFTLNLICSLNGLFFWHKLEKLYNNN